MATALTTQALLGTIPCPSTGSLDAYIRTVGQIPMLTLDEEQALATDLQTNGNTKAAERLVLSHLRMPVAFARGLLGYGLPHGDLIQEGNIGLMRAVKTFDPKQGARLCTYAGPWIKASMHEYIVRNSRMVRTATTKPMRKLFFNLRRIKAKMRNEIGRPLISMTPAQVKEVSVMLNVPEKDVREMEMRLSGAELSMDIDDSDQSDDGYHSKQLQISDSTHEPSKVLERLESEQMETTGLASALNRLDARSRDIVSKRWLEVSDECSGATLEDLSIVYGVSKERIRQIEAAAFKKLKPFLEDCRAGLAT